MKVTVRYFASLREKLGPTQTLELTDGTTLGGLRDQLIASSAAHAAALGRGRAVRVAMDQSLCDEAATIGADAEVAFFPPVTGG
jgi:molybdopterin synthase sulfur carrier subunit